MENTKTELERKVDAIDRKGRRFREKLDRDGRLDPAQKADAFHAEFRKTLATWGVTEEEYLEVSLKQ